MTFRTSTAARRYRSACILHPSRFRSHVEALEHRTLLAVVSVDTAAELVSAVNNGAAGDTINVAAGTYVLAASLQPKASMIIQGAGAGQTILTANWTPTYTNLPDSQDSGADDNKSAYLFNLAGNDGIKILHMTVDGADKLHGAIIGDNADNLELGHLRIKNTVWSGIRTYLMDGSNIHNNEFLNSGGKWQAGAPGTSGGVAGGGLYITYAKTSEIWNNSFTKTLTAPERNFFGIKGYQARNTRIHHNTINVHFSIELPHENDHYVEIDHNYLLGAISIPKGGGGSLPTGTNPYTFHIHHNYFRKSYALEWARNGAEVNNNLFDFATTDDGGNLITDHANGSSTPSAGWTKFHNNLVKNPGRGIYSSSGHVYNNISIYNNHVIGNTTAAPRTEGMFGLPTATEFSTISIKDNIFEFNGQSRPLFRNTASYASNIENNTLTNVSDSGSYSNPNTGATRGPTTSMSFTVGANDEYTVNGWTISETGSSTGTTVSVSDDSWITSGSPNANKGSEPELQVKDASADFKAYLKFDLAGVSTVNDAKLRLYVNYAGTPTTASIFQITNDSWTEGALTWNNAPAFGSSITSQPLPGAGVWVEFDVTSYIAAQASGDDVASLGVWNNNGKTIKFNTSENSVNQPQLVINGGGGSMIHAASGPDVQSTAPDVKVRDLRRLAAEAQRRWRLAGVSPSVFSGVRFAFDDLDGDVLARTTGSLITIDRNAAGHGWYIDRRPRTDREFVGSGPLEIDLLTVLTHELGHIAGLEHSSDGVMQPSLDPGVRIMPK